MSAPSLITRILGWLRAAYPDGIPPNDYPPVLSVLRRRLTNEDIEAIADDLALQSVAGGNAPVSADDVRRMVRDHVFQSATAEDVSRVTALLSAGGWPLDEGLSDHA